jgi:uncharacterized protein YbbC (DUF1343 family)
MVSFGAEEIILQNPLWKTQRLGLVTNHAATTSTGKPVRQTLVEAGFNLIKLFAPEHGLFTIGADGAFMHDDTDGLTGLPVISLYGQKLGPSPTDLQDLDMVLFDIPDIGTRFYTYLWTMTHVLEACGKAGIPLVILDRPNPLSGLMGLAEGPRLDENHCSSFIGRWDIPLRHSCTMGELAFYFNDKRQINAELKVVRCKGWARGMFHPDWEIDFVPASPAMRSFTTALLYPGTGLLEAANISEGRGTDAAFVKLGAPWLDPELLSEKLNQHLIGVSFGQTEFIPEESKYEGELCRGIEFIPLRSDEIKAVYNGLVLIRCIKDLFPGHFEWKPYPTNVNPTGKQHLDKLLGIFDSEKLFELSFEDFITSIRELTQANHWKEDVKLYLLY